jgi:hypothetical protein
MKSITKALLAAAVVAGITIPQSVSAQFSFEGRIGTSLPSGELTNDATYNQTGGFSFAVDGMYTFTTNLTAYAGASRQSFHCDGCPTDVSTAGFDGGLKYLFNSSGSATPWVRAGLLLHKASVEGVDSDWGLGVDSGVGLDWAIRPGIALVPAFRANSYSSGPVSLTYVTLDLGLHIHPGAR